jgi:serine/threonine protein kinase
VLILGKYELLEGETEGGLSRVLAGRSVVDGTHVAIKIVNGTGKESDRAIANDLYELELRNLKKLRGVPNVIQLLDHGFDASLNENILVLEWLEISLSERLSQVNNIVPAKDWVNFSQTLMRSVSRAHSRSIAHRDIKPGNIMFRTNSPNDWDCVLIDFGTSKYEGTDFEDANQTMREYRTPAYASSHSLEEDYYSRDF